MKVNAVVMMAMVGVAYAGLAQAGNSVVPAGGSFTSGAFITPPALSDALQNTPLPGRVGRILINNDQARAIAAYLRENGGTTDGSVTTAPTTFADGTEGKISIDTDTNVLTLQRA
jgi:hypothetical protein